MTRTRVEYRAFLPGVTHDDYWCAVRNGQRESVLAPPSEPPPAVYEAIRAVCAAFGAPAPVDELQAVDPERLRADLADFEREWAEAEPVSPQPAPLSPLERRQLRPRVRPVRDAATKPRPHHAPVGPAPGIAPPPGGAPRLPWALRELVGTEPGSRWWSLQIAGQGASPAGRTAYREALRLLEPASKS